MVNLKGTLTLWSCPPLWYLEEVLVGHLLVLPGGIAVAYILAPGCAAALVVGLLWLIEHCGVWGGIVPGDPGHASNPQIDVSAVVSSMCTTFKRSFFAYLSDGFLEHIRLFSPRHFAVCLDTVGKVVFLGMCEFGP